MGGGRGLKCPKPSAHTFLTHKPPTKHIAFCLTADSPLGWLGLCQGPTPASVPEPKCMGSEHGQGLREDPTTLLCHHLPSPPNSPISPLTTDSHAAQGPLLSKQNSTFVGWPIQCHDLLTLDLLAPTFFLHCTPYP